MKNIIMQVMKLVGKIVIKLIIWLAGKLERK